MSMMESNILMSTFMMGTTGTPMRVKPEVLTDISTGILPQDMHTNMSMMSIIHMGIFIYQKSTNTLTLNPHCIHWILA
jgi:hypothetical protein